MLIVALLCMFSCTTEVDICMSDSHQHLAEVELVHNLSKVSSTEMLPDSMIVVAYRVVNSWKCSYLSPRTNESKPGRYIYNNPQEVENDASGSNVNATRETSPMSQTSKFLVKRGDYRFMAFNNILDNVVFGNRPQDYWFGNAEVIDTAITNKSIYLHYKNYSLTDDNVDKFETGWSDFNQYSTYISNSKTPIVFCYTDICRVGDEDKNKVELVFDEITQNIEVYFTITHNEVVIDKVQAEISGIPCGMNLMTGRLDISKTYKTLFEISEVERTGDEWNGNVTYVGKLNVMGLVSSTSKDVKAGPGIMQLAVYTHHYDDYGDIRTKVFHLGINMYNTINKYSRVIGGFDESVVLEVEQKLVLTKDEMLDDSDKDSSVDKWIEYDDIHIDI